MAFGNENKGPFVILLLLSQRQMIICQPTFFALFYYFAEIDNVPAVSMPWS